MKTYISEIAIAILLIALSALLWNPYWMPMGALYVVIICFVVVLGGFTAFIWREHGGDEREVLIRQVASRSAYLVTAVIMAVGIVWQTLVIHSVDSWLIAAFIMAVLAKAIGYAYGRNRY
jgi:hypothetical protein